MNFSTDRDLLVLEPSVFVDVPFLAQQRLSIDDAEVDGTTVTTVLGDFAKAGIEPGHVVLIDRVAHEVISRDNATTLTVSLPRTRLADDPIEGPFAGSSDSHALLARTFEPQAALVHDAVLRLLGVDPAPGSEAIGHAGDAGEGVLTEDAVVSLSVMARLEALGTLERVYASAAALVGDHQPLLARAGEYRRRFHHARVHATVLIDTDGDGLADERRRLGHTRFARV